MKVNRKWVLDASALLALLNEETGSNFVEEAIEQGAVMGTVNLSEVVSKLTDAGVPYKDIYEILNNIGLEIIDFDSYMAYSSGLIRLDTRKFGLSFGDRACLALAKAMEVPCLTADRLWAELELPITIKLIR